MLKTYPCLVFPRVYSRSGLVWGRFIFVVIFGSEDERIPKDLLYSGLVIGKLNVGQLRLCYKGVCEHDLKSLNINIHEVEKLTDNRKNFRSFISQRLREKESNYLGDRTRGPKDQSNFKNLFISYFHLLFILLSCFIYCVLYYCLYTLNPVGTPRMADFGW